MRIKVTAEHIARGEPERIRECPVALALRDLGINDPCVEYGYVRFGEFGKRHSAHISDAVVRRIKRFDNGKPIQPFSFDLEVPT